MSIPEDYAAARAPAFALRPPTSPSARDALAQRCHQIRDLVGLVDFGSSVYLLPFPLRLDGRHVVPADDDAKRAPQLEPRGGRAVAIVHAWG